MIDNGSEKAAKRPAKKAKKAKEARLFTFLVAASAIGPLQGGGRSGWPGLFWRV